MRISDYEKRVVIPAIIRSRFIDGLYTTPKKALEVFEETQQKLGENSWSFVLWKKSIVKKAGNSIIKF